MSKNNEISVVFPQNSKVDFNISKYKLNGSLIHSFFVELTKQMQDLGLKNIQNLTYTSEKMPVSFRNAGIEDYWGHVSNEKISYEPGEAKKSVVELANVDECSDCAKKGNDCYKSCSNKQIVALLNTIKNLQR